MPSPFPGMDPYLEGYLWPDVHHALASKIRQQLTPHLKPRYVARLEVTVVVDSTPEVEIGIMYHDVEVVKVSRQMDETKVEYEAGTREGSKTKAPGSITIPPAPLTLPVLEPIEVRLVTVEIRNVADNELVTAIELLSPVNKREPGLSKYRRKRQRLYQAGIHLLEIDLLRRGSRSLTHPRLPNTPYLLTLTRAHTGRVEIWPIKLQDPLPVLPVPLHSPDPDVPLELAPALTAIYDEAAYELSVDYGQPPPLPLLPDEDAAWLKELLAEVSTSTPDHKE